MDIEPEPASVPPSPQFNQAMLSGIVYMTLGTVFSIVVVSIFKPDSLPTVAAIVGFMVPTIGGLLAIIHGISKQVTGVKIAVDGRLTELLKETKLAANAQGRADQIGGFPAPTTPEREAAKAAEHEP